MTKPDGESVLTYLGWSGFAFAFPGVPPVFIDPPSAADIPKDRDVSVLISHGHPEHISGVLGYLRDGRRPGAATIIAPPGMCRYLERRSRNVRDRFQVCGAGTAHTVRGGLVINPFPCRHMSLLPPEKGAALRRITQLAGNARLAASIAGDVVCGPRAGPLLGFRLMPADGPSILFFGEGLHRNTAPDGVAEISAMLPADILIAAIEPEDLAVLPELMAAAGAPIAVPYEAHCSWRDGFGMPHADLAALSLTLTRGGIEVVRAPLKVPIPLPFRGTRERARNRVLT